MLIMHYQDFISVSLSKWGKYYGFSVVWLKNYFVD